MSAMEFAEWMAVFTCEELHPAAERARHAQLLASAMNGPVSRRDKRFWRASDLVATDRWAEAGRVVDGSSTADRPRTHTAAEVAASAVWLNSLIDP